MRLVIIGAGPAGLVAEKYCLEHNHECDVFEQTGDIGGTWVYTDCVGFDEDGTFVHTSMYKNLTTNFPKELMSYVDFPYPKEKTKSYIGQEEVLDYFHSYAKRYKLKNNIQFYKRVLNLTPNLDEKWIVTVEDVKTKVVQSLQYDGVFICNGRFFDPILPGIPGQKLFKGVQLHSRDFRTPAPFANKRVLIIGGAYSGQELSLKIVEVAQHVTLSHRPTMLYIDFTDKLTKKPEVAELTETGAIFVDGSTVVADCILYCTGFQYVCPFLSEECGLTVANNWVRPLYKQIINIERSTMYFIGLPYVACGIPMFDLQVRFSLAALEKKFSLPSKEDMIRELEEYMVKRREQNIPDREAHKLGNPKAQEEYFLELSDASGIQAIPAVINKLYNRIKTCTKLRCSFKIIDQETFAVIQ